MEYVRGYKIRDILLDNGNWWKFFLLNAALIRPDIVINVIKILACGTAYMGYHLWVCPECTAVKAVFHTCKSRFCSSCGKKATDTWIQKNLNILPKTTWQHITFTFPQELRALFWLNRHLMNDVMPIPAKIITKIAKKYGVIPGIFLALHTFGRDLKRNPHMHLSTTLSGLSLNQTKWINKLFFDRNDIAHAKTMWRYEIVSLLRRQYKSGKLKLPKNMINIKTYTAFNAWLDTLSWIFIPIVRVTFIYPNYWNENPCCHDKRRVVLHSGAAEHFEVG